MERGAWWVTVHGVTKSRTQFSDRKQKQNTLWRIFAADFKVIVPNCKQLMQW